MSFLLSLIISAAVVLIAAWITPGVHIRNFWSAMVVAIILALLNMFLRPLLVVFSIPITIMTFGFFLFIINGLVVWIASKMVSGFYIESFGWALLYSLFLSIISYIFEINNAESFFN